MTKNISEKVANISLVATYEFISQHCSYRDPAYLEMMQNTCSGNGTAVQGIIFAAARL